MNHDQKSRKPIIIILDEFHIKSTWTWQVEQTSVVVIQIYIYNDRWNISKI